jgi:dihydroorotate dehydrogenase electron transfer subunit
MLRPVNENASDPSASLPGLVPWARQSRAVVISQRQLARGTYCLRLRAPELSRTITPGQFLMIRPAEGTDPLLGRPFALYDTVLDESGAPFAFEFVYHVIGKMTGIMSGWQAGEEAEIWGPLGNGFPAYAGRHLMCIGGGIGYTPFLAVARETLGLRQYGTDAARYAAFRPARVTFAYGVGSRPDRADLSDFEQLNEALSGLARSGEAGSEMLSCEIQLATDDGSEGHHGFVTDLLERALSGPSGDRPDGVYCCGPEPMMHVVARICLRAGVPCWLSLETPMACGFGACFSCVTRVTTADGEWDYRRTCVEGPVFPAAELALPEL